MQPGHPTKYNAEQDKLVYNLALLGATDQEMADTIGIAIRTFCNWKTKYPSFMQSLKDGKAVADANVGKRLYQRAIGYSHPDCKVFNHNGEAMVVPITKHYPPDVTACIFWLKNRQPEKWRDVQRVDIGQNDNGVLDKLASVIHASKERHGVE
jgi:hypothetical protein